MRKILILIMSCRADFFKEEVNRIRRTWGSKLPDNITLGYYDGNPEKPSIIIEDDGCLHIKTCANDSLEWTYMKTLDAMRMILNDKRFNFDWIMRVNTSTWVNIPLVNKFINEIADDDVLYASELYSLTEAACPFPLMLYARGNAFMISNKMIRILINEGLPLMCQKIVDDVSIGNILNSYFIKTGQNYIDHIRGVPHGWFRCVSHKGPNGHQLCIYGADENQDFYNRFMTVQTKMYRHRENEHQNMEDFYNMMKDAPEPSLDCTLEYMKDPSVFLGSAIGYVNMSKWRSFNMEALYDFEMCHKAVDDKENINYSKEAYDLLHHVPGMK